MKALCPECGGTGCSKCKDGYTEITFPSGPGVKMYSKVCKDCGTCIGGGFLTPENPEPLIYPSGSTCYNCHGKNIVIEICPEEVLEETVKEMSKPLMTRKIPKKD